MDQQVLSWIVTAVGITGFFLAGKKVWWCWYVNLACQAIWYAYAIISEQPAFLVAATFYTAVFGWNAYNWTREHIVMKKLYRDHAHLSQDLMEDEEVPESNLLKHARFELTRLGEDTDVIDWYLDVVDAYRSFGHSGGSHFATLPVIFKLLNFEPLTPLTNDPEEWHFHGEDIWGAPGGVWQNRRDGRMFSNDGGLTYTSIDDPKKEDGSKEVYCSQITNPVSA